MQGENPWWEVIKVRNEIIMVENYKNKKIFNSTRIWRRNALSYKCDEAQTNIELKCKIYLFRI